MSTEVWVSAKVVETPSRCAASICTWLGFGLGLGLGFGLGFGLGLEPGRLDLHLLEELGRHLLERVRGPVAEPVDGGARDERGEHAHLVR
eukprot:scaffold102624_cov36-Phaeocystis_antarctica.AAC.1